VSRSERDQPQHARTKKDRVFSEVNGEVLAAAADVLRTHSRAPFACRFVAWMHDSKSPKLPSVAPVQTGGCSFPGIGNNNGSL